MTSKLDRRAFLHLTAGAAMLPALPRSSLGAEPIRPARYAGSLVMHPVAPRTFWLGSSANTWRKSSASHLSSKTGPARRAILRPRRLPTRHPTDTHYSWSTRQTQSMRRFMRSSTSTSCATLCPLQVSSEYRTSWRSNPALPARSVPEFIAYARANPGKVSFGSGGAGTSVHMSGELFKMLAGIDMVHVPYRGAAPAVMDLIAGHVQVVFDNLPGSIEHVRAGKLRALAVTTKTRVRRATRCSDFGGGCAGLRGQCLVRLGYSERNVASDHRQAQHCGECCAYRSKGKRKPCRAWWHANGDDNGGIYKACFG